MSSPSPLAGMKAVRDDPNDADPDGLPFMKVTGYVVPCTGAHLNEGSWALFGAELCCCDCAPTFAIDPD